MSYQIIDEITSADIAFRVKGTTMEESFLYAGKALISIMIMEPETLGQSVLREFIVEEASTEMLLYEYLNEILFYKDSERILLVPDIISIRKKDCYSLKCIARGDSIDCSRHHFKIDIKAVTMHSLSVKETVEGWTAMAVVDV